MNRVSASKIVALRVAKARAKGRGKGSDGDQVDLFEAEGGRKYSRQYRRSKEKELQSKGKGGGPKVFGKARFSSRSEAGRYAANMRWQGQGEQESAGSDTIAARDIKSPKITQIKYGSINSIGEGTYESDRSKIENYLDELKSVGERILGVQGFKEKFGRTVTSIQDELEDNSRILAGSPLNELARANNLQADLAQLEPRLNVISDKRPLGRDRSMTDNDLNDDGEDIASLRETYANDIVTDFADLPNGGFRETVIRSFIDRQANSFYEEPGRSRGPYDRPVSRMDDKQYAKARAHALKGRLDNGPSLLDEYWDDNESDFWDEYDSVLENDK